MMGQTDNKTTHAVLEDGESGARAVVPVLQQAQWTPEEEKAVVRRMDLIIMPLLMIVFFALQLDRGNIGNALTDDFLKDVDITQGQYNIGQQLLSVGIVLLEIPSNLVLYRVGPRIWMGGQIFAWGLVALFQAFQHGLGAWLTTRLLLGLCEAGFIPAGFYCITMYYKPAETSKRFSIFFIGNMAAVALGSVLAYGILHMRGIAGLTGWQWMFILEGLYTIVAGTIFALLFPDSLANPVPLLGFNYFSAREREIMQARLLDDPSKLKQHANITKKEIWAAVSDWTVWPHILATLCALANVTTINNYAPTLVAGFGYPKLKSNALTSVGGWCVIFVCVLGGFVADRINKRGFIVLACLFGFWAFSLGSFLVVNSTSKEKRYALLTMAIAFSVSFHPINGSWLALNAKTAGERSIRMAMFVMAANAAGIIGGQTFQAKDKPKYHTGWAVIMSLNTLAVVFIIIANVQYRVLNRKIARRGGLDEDPKTGVTTGNGIGVTRKYGL